MLERREDLKELQTEVLDKFCIALESIPLPILQQFPKFDTESFKKLQSLYRHIKAKLRLVQTKLSKLQKEDGKNIFESPETPRSTLSKSIKTPISCMSKIRLINDYDNLDTSCISVSKAIESHQDSTNVTELYINVKEHDNKMGPMLAVVKSPEITLPNKKSTFQLKRPIKTVLDSEDSKTIAEMWERDQQMSTTVNSSMDSDCVLVKDTFNDNIKMPNNEKNMLIQKNVLDSSDSPDNEINRNKGMTKLQSININSFYLEFLMRKYF